MIGAICSANKTGSFSLGRLPSWLQAIIHKNDKQTKPKTINILN
jgi:hypothetical protein